MQSQMELENLPSLLISQQPVLWVYCDQKHRVLFRLGFTSYWQQWQITSNGLLWEFHTILAYAAWDMNSCCIFPWYLRFQWVKYFKCYLLHLQSRIYSTWYSPFLSTSIRSVWVEHFCMMAHPRPAMSNETLDESSQKQMSGHWIILMITRKRLTHLKSRF